MRDRAMTIHMMFFLSIGLVLSSLAAAATDDGQQFVYSGFAGKNLTLDGAASVTATGLVELTNTASTHQKGHAFHPTPLRLRASPAGGTVRSFSVAFVFGIVSSYTDFSTHGLALVFAPRRSLPGALTDQYLGLTNIQDDGKPTNHMFAVELDTVQNIEFHDINANHVGIDINSLSSVQSHDAGYYDDKNTGNFTSLSLISREAMQVWVDYDGGTALIEVTMAPLGMVKPKKPLVFATKNLSEVLAEPSYIGFSASTGPVNTRHYALGLSFGMNGSAPAIDPTKLPKLPQVGSKPRSKVLEITLPLASAALVLAVGTALILLVRRRLRYREVREDWESEFGPRRFTYKDLFHATKGFKDRHLLGSGGFGMVYKGVLPMSGLEVAVKKVSHGSKQGMKEFIAEIVSIGRIRHRNLVQLLGYSRRKDELILVYDYIPNGSLEKYLYSKGDGDGGSATLDWAQRFHVIKGVASGLHFLHERWEKVVVHRDIKPSNVLLDKEMNGRLGDFGLAKLYEHGANPQTTRVVGTTGYLAPELVRSGKATPLTDVFAFGTFILEVACGQRPIRQDEQGIQTPLLVDWVLNHWHNDSLAETVDPRLRGEYNSDEVFRVLKIGLLCSHPSATSRPSMQQVLQYLDGEVPLPELTHTNLSFDVLALMQRKGLHIMSSPCSSTMMTAGSISDLSGGR
jgi:serine/threonine protein kinase